MALVPYLLLAASAAVAAQPARFIVTPEWLAAQQPRPVILEASWAPLETAQDYHEGHIPGAIHINTDLFETGYPRWHLRSPAELHRTIGSLGIGPQSAVVVYGKKNIAAARVWWILYYAGVRDVRIVNGGFAAWTRAGLPSETKVNAPVAVPFSAALREDALATTDWVHANRANVFLADVRSAREFAGQISGYSYLEAKGRIPGAHHLGDADDSARLYQNEEGTLRSPAAIETMWRVHNLPRDNEIVFYCGGGWRSSLAFLYARELGFKRARNYSDGWSGWSDRFGSR